MGLIDGAVAEGAKPVAGGRRIRVPGGGNWVEPTLFTDVTTDMEIAREEVFGPVLAAIPLTSAGSVPAPVARRGGVIWRMRRGNGCGRSCR
ncbi:aldehyde dehydrogenase family protein [Streptomyces sp. NPDC054940]